VNNRNDKVRAVRISSDDFFAGLFSGVVISLLVFILFAVTGIFTGREKPQPTASAAPINVAFYRECALVNAHHELSELFYKQAEQCEINPECELEGYKIADIVGLFMAVKQERAEVEERHGQRCETWTAGETSPPVHEEAG